MRGEENNFIIKMGIVPERINIVGYFIDKGEQHPLVYGINCVCVGVVVEHNNHEKQANGQAEICFYDKYYNEYNKWHRMYYGGHRNGKRINYLEILSKLTSNGQYRYTGYIMNK